MTPPNPSVSLLVCLFAISTASRPPETKQKSPSVSACECETKSALDLDYADGVVAVGEHIVGVEGPGSDGDNGWDGRRCFMVPGIHDGKKMDACV